MASEETEAIKSADSMSVGQVSKQRSGDVHERIRSADEELINPNAAIELEDVEDVKIADSNQISDDDDNDNDRNVEVDLDFGVKATDVTGGEVTTAQSMSINNNGNGVTMIKPEINKKSKRYFHAAEKNKSDGFYYQSPNPKDKHILFIEFKIKRISKIDTTAETFRCAFHYYLTWLASYDDWQLWCELKEKNKSKEYVPITYTPKTSFINVVDIHDRDSKLKYYVYDSKNNAKAMGRDEWAFNAFPHEVYGMSPWKARWNRCKYSFEATFAEQFELDSFPFDCQDLSIILKSDNPLSVSDIVPFPRGHGTDFISFDSSFSATGEWTYEGLLTEFSNTDELHSKAGKKYSKINISIKAKRNWRAHQSSIIISGCMFFAGLCTFAIDHRTQGIEERLAFGITLLLADVATMQFIFGNVPNIPYFTLFDKYVHFCFRFLFAIIVWCAILGVIERICKDFDDIVGDCSSNDNNTIIYVDYVMFLVFTLVYIATHWILWVESRKATLRENSKIFKTSRQLEGLFDDSKNLVLIEKRVMYVNCKKWEEGKYLFGEEERAINALKESYETDIIEFGKVRQTMRQQQREKNKKLMAHRRQISLAN